MSDIPPAEQPQGTPARRVTRSKLRSSAARRARMRKPVAADMALSAEENAESQEEATSDEAAQDDEVETSLDEEVPAGDFETALAEASDEDASPQKRRLTPLSRQILLWGAITAGIYLLWVLVIILFTNAFAATDAQEKQNSAIVTPVACLSFLIPYILPFVAGWRATVREGLGRHGGLAGLLGYAIYTLVALVIGFAISAAQGKGVGVSGSDLLNVLIQTVISFAFGWFGGTYSSWQRKRAEQKRAQAAEATTPSA